MHEDEWAMVLSGEHAISLCDLGDYAGASSVDLSFELEESCSMLISVKVKISRDSGRIESLDGNECVLHDLGDDSCAWTDPDKYHCGPCDFEVTADNDSSADIRAADCDPSSAAASCLAKYCCGGYNANYRLYKPSVEAAKRGLSP